MPQALLSASQSYPEPFDPLCGSGQSEGRRSLCVETSPDVSIPLDTRSVTDGCPPLHLVSISGARGVHDVFVQLTDQMCIHIRTLSKGRPCCSVMEPSANHRPRSPFDQNPAHQIELRQTGQSALAGFSSTADSPDGCLEIAMNLLPAYLEPMSICTEHAAAPVRNRQTH